MVVLSWMHVATSLAYRYRDGALVLSDVRRGRPAAALYDHEAVLL